MNPDLITAIVFGLFFVLLISEVPVGFALAISGALGITLLRDADLATSTLGSVPFRETSTYSLAIIPMYILLGMFALHGRLAERVYGFAARVLRRVPGGLGIATVGACAGFAAVSGSSVATAASIGKISVHEMVKGGYKAPFAGGIVAIGGTLGILIPPSVAMVLYGVIARESISDLLVAGVVPGVLAAVAYSVFIAVRSRSMVVPAGARLEDSLVVAGGGSASTSAATSSVGTDAAARGLHEAGIDLRDLAASTEESTSGQQVRGVLWIGLIFGAIVVGMFSGLFTVIESAAIGAVIALVMLVVENVRGGVRDVLTRGRDAILEAASVTSMAFALVIGAGVLSTYLVMARIPMRLTEFVVDLDLPPAVIVVLILAILIPLGMFLETLSILVIVVPLVHPVVVELGYDGVWFAVLFVIMLEIGLVTPPIGMNTFVVSMTSGLKLEEVFQGVLPFLLVSLAVVALVFTFPDLALWLPGQLAD